MVLKQRFACVAAALALAASILPAMPASAAEDGSGEVTFEFYVDSSLRGKEMEMVFMDMDAYETVSVVTDQFKESSLTTEMPAGTYELAYINYDGDWNFNYNSSIDPETFTVTEGGEAPVVSVTTTKHVVTNTAISTTFKVDGEFSVIHISLYGETDAYYTRGDVYQQEEYTIVIDSGSTKTVDIDAGTYFVTNINAYGDNMEPVDISYPTEITLSRSEDLEEGKSYTLYTGDAGTGDGYATKSAADMDSYTALYDNKTVLSYDEVTGSGDALGVIDDQDSLELDTGELSADEEGDAGDDEDKAESEVQSFGFWVVIVLAAAILACILWYRRKRKNE